MAVRPMIFCRSSSLRSHNRHCDDDDVVGASNRKKQGNRSRVTILPSLMGVGKSALLLLVVVVTIMVVVNIAPVAGQTLSLVTQSRKLATQSASTPATGLAAATTITAAAGSVLREATSDVLGVASPPPSDKIDVEQRVVSPTTASSTITTTNNTIRRRRSSRRGMKETPMKHQPVMMDDQKYVQLRKQGYDEVSNTEESAALRNYRVRNMKRTGWIWKRDVSLSDVLFPRVQPQQYSEGEQIFIFPELVESKKTQIPFHYDKLPMCRQQQKIAEDAFDAGAARVVPTKKQKKRHINFGSRLQGRQRNIKPAPYELIVKQDMPCTPLCMVELSRDQVDWMRKLISYQYRVHLELDGLPVLMRSKELNYAVRGHPIGFMGPWQQQDFFLYNHIKFTITYHEDLNQFDGVRIIGFDVHPVSILHELPPPPPLVEEEWLAYNIEKENIRTCHGFDTANDPSKYLPLQNKLTLQSQLTAHNRDDSTRVLFSYDVRWIASSLPWSDRWDVYLVGTPDNDMHTYSIMNSTMLAVLMVACFYLKIVKKLRTELETSSSASRSSDGEESGWRAVRGDVFRPPQSAPYLLCILLGAGASVGVTIMMTLLLCVSTIVNPMVQGEALTCIVYVFVLCGSPVNGYVSSRMYKYFSCCDVGGKSDSDGGATNSDNNTTATLESMEPLLHSDTLLDVSNLKDRSSASSIRKVVKFGIFAASALPAFFTILFAPIIPFLGLVGAASALPILTLLQLFMLWLFVSLPLVLVGCYIGIIKSPKISVPAETNDTIREIPSDKDSMKFNCLSMFLGGIVPFSSIYVELTFLMSAVWLKQTFYATAFLIPMLFMMSVLCTQTIVSLCFRQLCKEDHRWWWSSFRNAAMVGVYTFLYSIWYMNTRLELVSILSIMVYLAYMTMVSVCLGLFCGFIGFVASFGFVRRLYVKVE